MTNPPADLPGTADALRDWAGNAVRHLVHSAKLNVGQPLTTVRSGWESRGTGWPQTVGEFETESKVQIVPQRYELILRLPPTTPEDFVANLTDSLRELAEEDQTLGDRLRSASVGEGTLPLPERVSDPEFGDDAWQVIVPMTVYTVETKGEPSD